RFECRRELGERAAERAGRDHLDLGTLGRRGEQRAREGRARDDARGDARDDPAKRHGWPFLRCRAVISFHVPTGRTRMRKLLVALLMFAASPALAEDNLKPSAV